MSKPPTDASGNNDRQIAKVLGNQLRIYFNDEQDYITLNLSKARLLNKELPVAITEMKANIRKDVEDRVAKAQQELKEME